MYIIAGLGNPGAEYEKTRHNMGFMVIDQLCDRLGCDTGLEKHQALLGKTVYGKDKLILAKPQTYMNNSGISIRALSDYYKVSPGDIIIVSDDIDLPPGKLRLRARGSAGGHNGIKSVISHLGTQDFPRVKVGVGEKPPGWDLADYVLAHLSADEEKSFKAACKNAADAVIMIIEQGMAKAMNVYNTVPEKTDRYKNRL